MITTLVWIVGSAFAGGTADQVCLDALPPHAEHPPSRRELRRRLRAGQVPRVLLPGRFESRGFSRPEASWVDGAGGRHPWHEVRGLLMANPWSRPYLEALEAPDRFPDPRETDPEWTARTGELDVRAWRDWQRAQEAIRIPRPPPRRPPVDAAVEDLWSSAVCAWNRTLELEAWRAEEQRRMRAVRTEHEGRSPPPAVWNLAASLEDLRGHGLVVDIEAAGATQACLNRGANPSDLAALVVDAAASDAPLAEVLWEGHCGLADVGGRLIVGP